MSMTFSKVTQKEEGLECKSKAPMTPGMCERRWHALTASNQSAVLAVQWVPNGIAQSDWSGRKSGGARKPC
jgi:hypothetical protein